MQYLLALILCFNEIGVVRANAYMLAPGLSVKNALLYSAVGLIIMSAILGKKTKVEMSGVMVAFGLLVAYALVSMVAVLNAGIYPHYMMKESILRIKSEQLDWLFFFTAFYLGVGTRVEAERLLRFLLAVVCIGNVITLWNAAGLPAIGATPFNLEVPEGSLRRIDGYYGHANETGTMLVLMLPAMIVVTMRAVGAARVMWFGFTIATAGVLLGGVSRGAFAGLVGGLLWGGYLFRHYLSVGRFLRWAAIAVFLALLILPFVGAGYMDKFVTRFTGMNMVSARDVSSGRSDMWMEGIRVMVSHPWSFISGVGWNTWHVQGFNYLPHNQYLSVYFDMGLLGLGCFIYVQVALFRLISRTVKNAPNAADRLWPLAIGFGLLIYAIGITFSNMTVPWIFVWPFYGLAARYCLTSLEEFSSSRKSAAKSDARKPVEPERRDPYSLPKRSSPGRPAVPVAARRR